MSDLFLVIEDFRDVAEAALAEQFHCFVSVGNLIAIDVDVRSLAVIVSEVHGAVDDSLDLRCIFADEVDLRIVEYLVVLEVRQAFHVLLHGHVWCQRTLGALRGVSRLPANPLLQWVIGCLHDGQQGVQCRGVTITRIRCLRLLLLGLLLLEIASAGAPGRSFDCCMLTARLLLRQRNRIVGGLLDWSTMCTRLSSPLISSSYAW